MISTQTTLTKTLLLFAVIFFASVINVLGQDIFPEPKPDHSNDYDTGYVININGDSIKVEFDMGLSNLRYRPINTKKFARLIDAQIKEFPQIPTI